MATGWWVFVVLECCAAALIAFLCLLDHMFSGSTDAPHPFTVLFIAGLIVSGTMWVGGYWSDAPQEAVAAGPPAAAELAESPPQQPATAATAAVSEPKITFGEAWEIARDRGPFVLALILAVTAVAFIIAMSRANDFDELLLAVVVVAAALCIGGVVPWTPDVAVWLRWLLLAAIVAVAVLIHVDEPHFAALTVLLVLVVLQGTGAWDWVGLLCEYWYAAIAVVAIWLYGILPAARFRFSIFTEDAAAAAMERKIAWMRANGLLGEVVPESHHALYAAFVESENLHILPKHTDEQYLARYLNRAIYWFASLVQILFQDFLPQLFRLAFDKLRPAFERMVTRHNKDVLVQYEKLVASQTAAKRRKSY